MYQLCSCDLFLWSVIDKLTHCISKNDTDVVHYNFDTDQPILIIFGRDVAESMQSNGDLLSHLS